MNYEFLTTSVEARKGRITFQSFSSFSTGIGFLWQEESILYLLPFNGVKSLRYPRVTAMMATTTQTASKPVVSKVPFKLISKLIAREHIILLQLTAFFHDNQHQLRLCMIFLWVVASKIVPYFKINILTERSCLFDHIIHFSKYSVMWLADLEDICKVGCLAWAWIVSINSEKE